MQTKNFDNLAKKLDSEINVIDIQQAFKDFKNDKEPDQIFIGFTKNMKELLRYMGFEEVEKYTHDSVRFSGVRFSLKKKSHYKIGEFGRNEIERYCSSDEKGRRKNVVNENLKGVIGIGFNLVNFKYEESPSIVVLYENPISLFISKDVFYKPEEWREAIKEFYGARTPAIQSNISDY